MSKSLMRLAILSAPLVLTACGEGWEAQKTSSHFPYGNDRTAGSGVVYVRAKMMPEKELVTEPIMEEAKAEPVEETVEPVLEAEEIFSEAQKKGTAPAKKEMATAKEDKHSSMESQPIEKQQPFKEIEEKHSSHVEPHAGTEGYIEEAFTSFESLEDADNTAQDEITAEDYIAQAPKRIVAKKVEVIKSTPQPAGSKGLKTAGVDDSGFEGEEIVEVFENEVIQPQKEIVVPKKDPTGYMSVGEETLEEIYNNDF